MKHLPDQLSARIHQNPAGAWYLSLRTFDPDNDDEGRAYDAGVTLIEDGAVVEQMDDTDLRQLAALLENSATMYWALRYFLVAYDRDKPQAVTKFVAEARKIMLAIDSGSLMRS